LELSEVTDGQHCLYTQPSYITLPIRSRVFSPHTNGPLDVPRWGALSLLQKPLHHRGVQKISLFDWT